MGKLNCHQTTAKSQKPTNLAKKRPLKIKYISSPVMVKASSASEFRTIVQELTGKDSNAGGFPEYGENTSQGLVQSVLQSQETLLEQSYVSNPMPFNGLLDGGLSWRECSEVLGGVSFPMPLCVIRGGSSNRRCMF